MTRCPLNRTLWTLLTRVSLVGFVVGMLFASPGWALAPEKSIDDYVQDRWRDGPGELPQITVLAIAQDSEGYIWAATQSGLARFDGVHFTVFREEDTPALGGDIILSLKSDRRGNLWIGGYRGLARHTSRGFTALKAPTQNPLDIQAIDVSPDGTDVAVATTQGVFHVTGDTLTADPVLTGPTMALTFARDALWAGSLGGVIRKQAGKIDFQMFPGLGVSAVTQIVSAEGTLWAGTAKGLFRLGNSGWEYFPITPGPPTEDKIGMIYEDHDGNLWVGSHVGLTRIRGGVVVESTPSSSRAISENYRAAIEDTEGSLWLGAFAQGLARLWNGWTQRFSISRGLNNQLVWSVAAGNDGSVWTGTDDGLALLKQGHFTQVVPGSALPDPTVYTLLVEGDTVWIGTRHGLAVYDGKQVLTPAPFKALAGLQINAILRDPDGVLWIGTSTGLYRFQNDRLDSVPYPDGELGWVRALFLTSSGQLLVGSEHGLMQVRAGRLQRDTEHPGLPTHLDVLAIDEPVTGSLMVGSMNTDLYGYQDGSWFRYSVEQNIPTNRAFFIGHASGMLWVAGEAGLYRVPLADLAALRKGRLQRANSEELINNLSPGAGGQRGYCCNGAGNAKGYIGEGHIWLPTREGVVSMATGLVERNNIPPPLHIESVRFHYHTITLLPGQIIDAPLGVRDFTFNFTALSFQNPSGVQIKYRLLGYDHEWQMVDHEADRSIRYTNLGPGSYSFQIIGSNNAGLWNDNPASVLLNVPPHFYETRAFQALAVLLLALLIYLANWLKSRSAALRQRQLEALVTQRTAALALANRQLQDASTTDPLTSLRNRRFVTQQLPSDLMFYQRKFEHERDSEDLTVLLFVLLDVDHFKAFNDTHGHHSGDVALMQLGGFLSRLVRTADYIVRWGGEEFLIVFRPMRRSEVAPIVERLRSGIETEDLRIGAQMLRITCSIGFATFPLRSRFPMMQHWQRILEIADQALYFVKRTGRNGWAGFHADANIDLASLVDSVQFDMQDLLDRGDFNFVSGREEDGSWIAPIARGSYTGRVSS